MFTTKNLLIAAAIIAGILIIINWDKLKKYFSAGTVTEGNGYGDLPTDEVITRLANQVSSETAGQKITFLEKYDRLNKKLAKYGLMVLPEGVNPPASNLKKCCCRSSIFFGVIGVNCYWNVDCNSQSAQTACAQSGA